MVTREEDVEITALRSQGWSISAIARHTGRSRNTIRAYLRGDRKPGERRRPHPDPVERFMPYIAARFRDDPHLWVSALHDELVEHGYQGAYTTLVQQVRRRGLRPHCEACHGVKGRVTVEITHPPGEEMQWDWLELPGAPWGDDAHLLCGTLSYSGKMRAVFADAEDEAHFVEALDAVLRRFGGTPRRWRFDRMGTVVHVGTDRLLPAFAAVAKHYGVHIDICPPRRGNRKGVVEKANHFVTQRWWRTARIETPAEAQASLDRFLQRKRDTLRRAGRTVAALAEDEALHALPPTPFPATVCVERHVDAYCLVAFRGNRYAVPPGLARTVVQVRRRLGSPDLEIVAASGAVVARHRCAPDGAGAVVRRPEDLAALEAVVLSSFTTARPCRRKENRPPSPAALAALEHALGSRGDVVVDLSRYAAFAEAAR